MKSINSYTNVLLGAMGNFHDSYLSIHLAMVEGSPVFKVSPHYHFPTLDRPFPNGVGYNPAVPPFLVPLRSHSHTVPVVYFFTINFFVFRFPSIS